MLAFCQRPRVASTSPLRPSSRGVRSSLPSVDDKASLRNRRGVTAFDLMAGLMGRSRAESDCSQPESECSTCCPSEGSDSEPGSPGLPPAMNQGGVIFLDWDDTLFPTSWLRKTVRSRGAPALPLGQLREHAVLIEKILRSAREVSKVAIVTLAKPGWVTNLAKEYFPGFDLESLLDELSIEIHYARDENCPGAFDAGNYEVLKRSAMRRSLLEYCSRHEGCVSVMSIGDDTIEQDALKGLMSDKVLDTFVRRPVCKTLKLMDSPTLSQLTEELRHLAPLLKPLVLSSERLEARVKLPAEVNVSNLHL